MGVNYSILCDVELDAKSIQKQLNGIKGKVKLGTSGAAEAGAAAGKEFGKSFLSYQVSHAIFSKSVDAIKSMVDQVYELDKAQIEFKKVSDLSGQALDDYVGKLTQMGGEVARTGSEMIEAATEFRKNSFGDEDSAQLAKVATMFQNISDEEISAGDSASFIISQMIAFGIEAENAEHIIDAVNNVSNNFSVSSGDLAKSLGVVSASSSAMGNSFEETLGLTQ